jgi:hypothetical protein
MLDQIRSQVKDATTALRRLVHLDWDAHLTRPVLLRLLHAPNNKQLLQPMTKQLRGVQQLRICQTNSLLT